MKQIMDRLLIKQTRDSTSQTYLRIWRSFNAFIIKLDTKLKSWEDRVTLYVGFLIEKGLQSSTIKSYVSAIKRILIDDGYEWDNTKVLLVSLTHACRLVNDKVRTRLQIQCGLLDLILFEVQRKFSCRQYYLQCLYMALFALGSYGLMRVGEMTESQHVIKARNIHIAVNKNKILIVLYSSKTHSRAMRPQEIKIVANYDEQTGAYIKHNFCPFRLLRRYVAVKDFYVHEDDQFFVFRDGSLVRPQNLRDLLKEMITKLRLNSDLYGMHSLRIRRCTDLIKYNYSLDEVRMLGRWRLNTVFKYIRG